jgi:hypothetical protein
MYGSSATEESVNRERVSRRQGNPKKTNESQRILRKEVFPWRAFATMSAWLIMTAAMAFLTLAAVPFLSRGEAKKKEKHESQLLKTRDGSTRTANISVAVATKHRSLKVTVTRNTGMGTLSFGSRMASI